ncbi:MAG: NUDIX domain-containing protein [Chloroflexi bacterium]|nr:NUDIX domain-containing protein [Chloroflexota bacterium]
MVSTNRAISKRKLHGSAAVCITPDRLVVLVSQDGDSWGLPGGRPQEGEDWRATLDREVFEEACVLVEDALLLGFVQGTCTRGPEEGLVLVRSVWRADVAVRVWEPRHEIRCRNFVPQNDALEQLSFPEGLRPIYFRWFHEALGT